MEQLLDLLGQEKPPLLSEATREAHLFGLLNEAAQACQLQGERLVLLVDGLDEDRGVTTGVDAHSIAKLLPPLSVAGMRVIVSGRPNPPIPGDVPQDHPLRDARIVRVLGRSSAATAIKNEAKRELVRLLNGSPIERDLLGLLTAAGGGLGVENLAELVGVEPWEVYEQLHSVSGRTFAARQSRFQPDTGPEVFVLGHEELQITAAQRLGSLRLAGYRERLHAWAEGYRQQGWPAGTPEYLLRGYYRMLQADGDHTRMIAYATDSGRHDRMLDITGGDAAALSEIVAIQDVILAHDEPDLGSLLMLSMHRNDLADRNNSIPTELPSIWVLLGQRARAEALARSITNPTQQAQALTTLAKVVAGAGDFDWAETIAGSIIDPYEQAWALTVLAKVVAGAGDLDRAGTLTGRAETVADSITDSYEQTQALTAIAKAAAGAGDFDRAETLADRAETIARSITNPNQQAWELTALAKVVAGAGHFDRARMLTDRAETIAGSITAWYERAQALTAITKVVAGAGDFDRAETIARSITHPIQRAGALTALAKVVAGAGDFDRAETIARSITNPNEQAQALTAIAKAAAGAGDLDRARTLADRAEMIARSITNPNQRAQALSALAKAAAGAGDLDRARTLADRAETIARSIIHPIQRAGALTALAKVVAGAGDFDRAETIARNITNPSGQVQALNTLAKVVAGAGDFDRAETIARSITNPNEQAQALTAIAKAAAGAGDL
ncbi:tetratricopeptide repeat protein, partial [Micromonospora orduensis]